MKKKETFQNIFFPANPDIGVTPLILKNTEELPIIPIRTSPLGKAGYFTAKCIRKMVYPVDPIITYTDQTQLLADLKADELAIVREQELISASATDKSFVILAPLFYEYIMCLTDKYSEILNISDLTKLKRNGRHNVIGVLTDSMSLFKVICKNRNLRLDLKDSSFVVSEYKLESDMLVDFGLKNLDAVFLITHPKDTVLQTYCNNNIVKFIDLGPTPHHTKHSIPYNPEDEDLVAEFRTAMKRDVPWIFPTKLSIDKIPNAVLSSVEGASRETGNISIQRVIYNTYKVRSMLCYKQLPESLILARKSTQIKGLATRLIRQYQTMKSVFNGWNPVRGNDDTADSTDAESFNFDELSSVPEMFTICPEMKNELKSVGLLNEESSTTCRI
jgi:hypothetical protein